MQRALRASRSWVPRSVAVAEASAALAVSCGTDDSEPVRQKPVALASNPTSAAIFTMACPPVELEFTNLCTGLADFETKGYWHNKNGLAEMTEADIAFANGLAPYAQPSSYFDAGDEPFDGLFVGGEAVASAFNNSGEYLAPAGSAKAEVSLFLVDPNAGGDPREQLAQQLLAFVFNIRHNLGSPDAAIVLPDGELMSGTAIVDEAVEVWLGDNAWLQGAAAQVLDQLNNDDALPVVMWMPCEVTYP